MVLLILKIFLHNCLNFSFYQMSKKKEKEDELVMYVLVNDNLKMGKGKIASQCMHSVCNATRILERTQKRDVQYLQWIKNGEPKIVLKSTEQDMMELLDNFEVDRIIKRDSNNFWCVCTIDAGKTQIEAGSLTTIVFRPCVKSKIPQEIKKMPLL